MGNFDSSEIGRHGLVISFFMVFGFLPVVFLNGENLSFCGFIFIAQRFFEIPLSSLLSVI